MMGIHDVSTLKSEFGALFPLRKSGAFLFAGVQITWRAVETRVIKTAYDQARNARAGFWTVGNQR
jgi:hypothetical protein